MSVSQALICILSWPHLRAAPRARRQAQAVQALFSYTYRCLAANGTGDIYQSLWRRVAETSGMFFKRRPNFVACVLICQQGSQPPRIEGGLLEPSQGREQNFFAVPSPLTRDRRSGYPGPCPREQVSFPVLKGERFKAGLPRTARTTLQRCLPNSFGV